MLTEMTIKKDTANILYQMISEAIQNEQKFPIHEDEDWMNAMLEAQEAFGDADRIVIGD